MSGQRATLRRRQTTFRWVAVLLATFLFALPLLGMLDFTTQGPGGVGRTADTWRTLVDVSTITADYPALRQGFLASESHPKLSPNDEFLDFGIAGWELGNLTLSGYRSGREERQ